MTKTKKKIERSVHVMIEALHKHGVLPSQTQKIAHDIERVRDLLTGTFLKAYKGAEWCACDDCDTEFPDVAAIGECPGCGTSFNIDPDVVAEEAAREEAAKKASLEDLKRSKEAAKQAKKAALRVVETDETRETLQKLDEREKRIDSLLKQEKQLWWDIGQALLEIKETNLWGVYRGFTSFAEYVCSRFGLEKTTAYRYLNVAGGFTRETATKISAKEGEELLKLPAEARAELLPKVEAREVTHKDLLEEVQKHKKEKAGKEQKIREEFESRSVKVKSKIVTFEVHPTWSVAVPWEKRRKERVAEINLGGVLFRAYDLEDKLQLVPVFDE